MTTYRQEALGTPAAGESDQSSRIKLFDRLLPLLLVGYIFLDRGFAWLHIPGTPLFVSEIVLAFGIAGALSVIARPVSWQRSSVVFLLVLYAGWGMIRTVPGLLDDPVVALRDSAIWIYVLVAFAVMAPLWARPHVLGHWLKGYRRLILPMVLWLPAVIILGDQLRGVTVPDSPVSLFSYKPGNAAVHLITAIAFMWVVWDPESIAGRRRRNALTLLAIFGILVVSTQGRGGFVAASMAGVLLLVYGRQRSRLILTLAISLFLIAMSVVVIDPRVNVDGRDISGEQLASNVTSIVTGEGQGELGGNIQWRIHHWGRVWEGTNEEVPLTGHGFAANIAEIYDIPQADLGLRNAHNSHLTLLARMGWIGASVWLLAWGFWYWETNRARRRLRSVGFERLSGLASWAIVAVTAIHINAIFDPTLEGPQVAFWLWSFCGLGLYLGIVSRRPTEAGKGAPSATEVAGFVDRALEPSGRK